MSKLSIFIIAILSFVVLTSNTTVNSGIEVVETLIKSDELGTQHDVSSGKFKNLIAENKYILVDIRTVKEFQNSHIKGSLNIDWYKRGFETEIQKLDKNTPILIYCRSGNRTGKAKYALLGMGFKKVYNLQYGINEWVKKSFELVK